MTDAERSNTHSQSRRMGKSAPTRKVSSGRMQKGNDSKGIQEVFKLFPKTNQMIKGELEDQGMCMFLHAHMHLMHATGMQTQGGKDRV
jgi:hypothetical protein